MELGREADGEGLERRARRRGGEEVLDLRANRQPVRVRVGLARGSSSFSPGLSIESIYRSIDLSFDRWIDPPG